ncbi:MAG: DUF3311 domain-containing protein [Rhizomicrobium sp.]
MRLSRRQRFGIGLALPFLSVIPTVPLLDRLGMAPLGVPLGLLWLFLAIPLTSLCLTICWLDDRDRPDEEIEPLGDGEERLSVRPASDEGKAR